MAEAMLRNLTVGEILRAAGEFKEINIGAIAQALKSIRNLDMGDTCCQQIRAAAQKGSIFDEVDKYLTFALKMIGLVLAGGTTAMTLLGAFRYRIIWEILKGRKNRESNPDDYELAMEGIAKISTHQKDAIAVFGEVLAHLHIMDKKAETAWDKLVNDAKAAKQS